MQGKQIYNRILICCMVLVLVTTACGETGGQSIAANTYTYPVGEQFADFYAKLGGVDRIGPCISPAFERGSVVYQYTVAVLMVYDPARPPSQRHYLANISGELNLENIPATVLGDGAYLDWSEMVSHYEEYGPDLLGKPRTTLLYNEERHIYEQYFENMGFYRDWKDPAGELRLMPYGAWLCAEKCPYVDEATHDGIMMPSPTPIVPVPQGQIESAILAWAERLGKDFTGLPLGGAYRAPDGFYEMVFGNVVLYVDSQNLGVVYLRDLPGNLGIVIQPPVPPRSPEDGFLFYVVLEDQNLGYNVPRAFWDMIILHGGFEVSGQPIMELQPLGEGASYQCFEKLCLEFQPTAPEQLRVRVRNLGSQYQHRNQQGNQPVGEEATSTNDILITVWERSPQLPASQEQEIFVQIREGITPLPNVGFALTMLNPDGSPKSQHYFPPTDQNGQSVYNLGLVPGAQASYIFYKVCLLGIYDPLVCVGRTFMIWGE